MQVFLPEFPGSFSFLIIFGDVFLLFSFLLVSKDFMSSRRVKYALLIQEALSNLSVQVENVTLRKGSVSEFRDGVRFTPLVLAQTLPHRGLTQAPWTEIGQFHL